MSSDGTVLGGEGEVGGQEENVKDGEGGGVGGACMACRQHRGNTSAAVLPRGSGGRGVSAGFLQLLELRWRNKDTKTARPLLSGPPSQKHPS